MVQMHFLAILLCSPFVQSARRRPVVLDRKPHGIHERDADGETQKGSPSSTSFRPAPLPVTPTAEALIQTGTDANVSAPCVPFQQWLSGIFRSNSKQVVKADSQEFAEPACETGRNVEFKLVGMHSYVLVPKCGPGIAYELNWNIGGCTESLCVDRPDFDGETIGPEEGLTMHPACSWGIVEELAKVYQYPWRQASLGAVMSALGDEKWKWQNLKNNWAAWRRGWKEGGFYQGVETLAEEAARTVDWKSTLNQDCSAARSPQEILEQRVKMVRVVKKSANLTNRGEAPADKIEMEEKPVTIGGVCWNMVIDFRDLWCHYKQDFDVTDEGVCIDLFKLPTRKFWF